MNVFNLFWENHQSGFEVCKLFRCDADKLFWLKHFKPHLVSTHSRNHSIVYKCELKINLGCVSIRYVPLELVALSVFIVELIVVWNEFKVKVIGCVVTLLLKKPSIVKTRKVCKEWHIPNLNWFVNNERELASRGNLLGLDMRRLLVKKLILFNL